MQMDEKEEDGWDDGETEGGEGDALLSLHSNDSRERPSASNPNK